MNERQQVVLEWLRKSDADFFAAKRELAVTDMPHYDLFGFLCQQCIEKLLKAG